MSRKGKERILITRDEFHEINEIRANRARESAVSTCYLYFLAMMLWGFAYFIVDFFPKVGLGCFFGGALLIVYSSIIKHE